MLKPETLEDFIVRLIALEVDRAEARLRAELCKSQNAESQFVRAELMSLRDDLCRILRDGAEPRDINMHLSDEHRRLSVGTKP